VYPLFFKKVFGIGMVEDAMGEIAEGKFGIAKQGFIGGGNEFARHVENGVGGTALNASSECDRFLFKFI